MPRFWRMGGKDGRPTPGRVVWGVVAAFSIAAASDGAGILAQTPSAALESAWDGVCAAVMPGSNLADRCDEIFNSGPGVGSRRSAAASGNNLDVVAAQGRVGRDDGKRVAQLDLGRISLFVSANRTSTDRDGSAFENGFDADEDTVLLGLDRGFSDSVSAGLTLRISDADTSFASGAGNLSLETHALTLFVTKLAGERHAIDVYAGVSDVDLKSQRDINYTLILDAGLPTESTLTIQDAALGNSEGDQFFAGIEWGYDAIARAVTFGPRASLRVLEHEIDAYSEAASSGLALAYVAQDVSSLQARAGFDVGGAVSRGWGVFSPSFHATTVHEFDDDARTVVSSFLEASSVPIGINTERPDRNYAEIQAALVATFKRGVTAYLAFDSRLGHDFLNENSIAAGLRFELGGR